MNLIENFREGIRSIRANLLRSVLTALIVAIGIFSLVGSLTAVEAIEASVAHRRVRRSAALTFGAFVRLQTVWKTLMCRSVCAPAPSAS